VHLVRVLVRFAGSGGRLQLEPDALAPHLGDDTPTSNHLLDDREASSGDGARAVLARSREVDTVVRDLDAKQVTGPDHSDGEGAAGVEYGIGGELGHHKTEHVRRTSVGTRGRDRE